MENRIEELIALLTGILCLLSFIGWGAIAGEILAYKRKSKIDNYVHPVLGMSVVLIIGGYLNVFQLVNRVMILLVLSIGLVGLVVTKFLKINKTPLQAKVATKNFEYVIATLAALGSMYIYVISILNKQFNGHDDFEGYFSFANKFAQIGTLGSDPFSARRLVSSLGGQSFLDSITLTLNSSEFLHATDSGLGLLLLISTTFSYYRMKKWKISSVSILVFAIASINPMAVNITAVYTLSAIVFVLITLILDYNDNIRNDHLVVFFALASAGLALKNSASIFIILLSIFYVAIVNFSIRRIRELGKNLVQGSFVFFLCLFPWCFTLYLSNGTFQYPLLGKGFHGSSYGDFNYSVNIFTSEFLNSLVESIVLSPLQTPILTILLITILFTYVSKSSFTSKLSIFILFGIIIINYVAISIGTANYGAFRYNFPFLFAFTLAILQFTSLSKPMKLFGVLSISFMISAIQIVYQTGGLNNGFFVKVDPKPISNLDFYPNQSQITNIQEVIPAKRRVLLRTGYNFLFDFKRNELLIADFPGESSPPPGIPLFSTSVALRKYLVESKVTYLIFQYSGLFDKETYSDRLDSGGNPWLRVEAQNAFAFKDRVLQLASSENVLYKDSKFIVIELKK